MPTRGFITIATGNEKYYKLAVQLLRSYRDHCPAGVPFAIICDRENDYTQEFDDVVVMDSPNRSYMDKLMLYRYSPYDETIFIDADSLVLADPSGLWDDYADADDVSCCGVVYPLDSDRGWFRYDGCGKYKEQVKFLLDLHGGIYYFRRTQRCREIFETAIELADNYSQYGFRCFDQPADEPVMALSMAIHNCRPCAKPARLLFVPSYWGKLRVNVHGELLLNGKPRHVEILHFATPNTELFLYNYLVACAEDRRTLPSYTSPRIRYIQIKLRTFPKEFKSSLRHGAGQFLRKLLPADMIRRLRGG